MSVMVNESTENLGNPAVNTCPLCYLELPVDEECGRDGSKFYANCLRCDALAITMDASIELRNSPLMRRRVQWYFRKYVKYTNDSDTRHIIIASRTTANSEPHIHSLQTILATDVPDVGREWTDDCLLIISSLTEVPGDAVILDSHNSPLFWYPLDKSLRWQLNYMHKLGLIEYSGGTVSLTVEGWERIDVLQRRDSGRTSNTVFIASWFDSCMDEPFHNGIKMSISDDLKLNPVWLKVEETIQKIDDVIIDEIRKSKFVVADFTGHRQAVYFEAGFAMGLGTPLVWTCRSDHLAQASFDTRQYSHIVWNDPEDLRAQLTRRIRALELHV